MVYRWKFASWTPSLGYEAREKLLERYVAHASAVSALAFHPYGRIFFSGDWDGALNAWLRYDSDAFAGAYDQNTSPGTFFTGGVQRMRVSAGQGSDIVRIRITEDGQYLLLVTQSGMMELWKVRGFRRLCQMQAHKGLIYDARFTPDRPGIVTLGRDEQVRQWNIAQQPDPAGGPALFSLVLAKDRSQAGLRQLAPLADGRLVAGTDGGEVVEVQLQDVQSR
jgi:WD40 repeat protein